MYPDMGMIVILLDGIFPFVEFPNERKLDSWGVFLLS